MVSDAMTVRLHLRRLRVVEVLADVPERLEVLVVDARRVVRCPYLSVAMRKSPLVARSRSPLVAR